MKIGICTGGGDCPGLNAVIRAAVKHAVGTYGWEVWGIKDSFNGLMQRPYAVRQLKMDDVSEILTRGGTILGTTNRGNPFSLKTAQQLKATAKEAKDLANLIVEAYRDLGLDCVLVIGGDGTQGIAYQLSSLGINVVGIPKTIDNDLACTDLTVGFETALEVATDAVERLQSTAESHDRVMILEVMGRGAGHLALHAGIAGGAHVILLPEIPFSYDAIAKKLKARQQMGRHYNVIVVAEGAFPEGGKEVFSTAASGVKNLGGIGSQVAEQVHKLTGMETRVTVLGHTQRGGRPTHRDRILGSAYGVRGIELIKDRGFGKLVAYSGGRFTEISYQQVAGRFRPVDLNDDYLFTAERIGICLGRDSTSQAF